MIGLSFLMKYLFSQNKKWIHLSLRALFIFFSFFTKQDGGALAFIICFMLLAYYCIYEKKWSALLIFLLSTAVVAFAMITPLTRFSFDYWFNYGQPPHTSRLSIFEIVDEFLYSSQWIKFYLLLIVLIVIVRYRSIKLFLSDKRNFIFLLLTLGILAEAAILQVTSYTPPDNNIFFHSFAFAFIFSALSQYFNLNLYQLKPLLVIGFLLTVWWSGIVWKYIQGPIHALLGNNRPPTNENVVNRHTYILNTYSGGVPMDEWAFSELNSFKNIRMPKTTIQGIDRLLNSSIVKNNKNLHVLNMTELTPLTIEMPYQLETGAEIPLWYHLGVSMFNRQAEEY
jgi:hypothetical protein